ncbi:hypothetical protein [uncultured Bacteroides sp.]|uniref:hypothetical protein n=1 Tax=uncultured Bacteroides sp. TaxID=162156 RepID=UPI0025F09B2C|nr:hypothetical protein [uncultured Bacteroides sp.]
MAMEIRRNNSPFCESKTPEPRPITWFEFRCSLSACLELQFQAGGTKVSRAWNYSFSRMELQFHHGGTKVSCHENYHNTTLPDRQLAATPQQTVEIPKATNANLA